MLKQQTNKFKKPLSFASIARRKNMVKKLMISIAVVLTIVNLYCMYSMTILNSSMRSSQSDVLREQQRQFTGKDPAAAVASSSSPKVKAIEKEPIADTAEIAQIEQNANGADNHGQKENVADDNDGHTGGNDEQLQDADGDGEQSDNFSFQDSPSPYYVTPKVSSHMKTNGTKPLVTGKHAMSVAKLKRNTGAPIIVVGMMKAGTTSVFGYFKCGVRKVDERYVSHYDCKPNIKDRTAKTGMSCGRRMLGNIINKRDAFDGMDRFVVYAEIDAQRGKGVVLPQWKFLNEIHKQFPRATFILNMRDPKKWIKSIDKWKDLRQRFIDLNCKPEFPKGNGKTDAELEAFYLLQAQKVRDFVNAFPSHELVEIDIGSEDTGQIMQDSFGITKDCWGIRNSNHDGDAKWKMLPDDMEREKEAKRQDAKYDPDVSQVADTAETAQLADTPQNTYGADNHEPKDNVDEDNVTILKGLMDENKLREKEAKRQAAKGSGNALL